MIENKAQIPRNNRFDIVTSFTKQRFTSLRKKIRRGKKYSLPLPTPDSNPCLEVYLFFHLCQVAIRIILKARA